MINIRIVDEYRYGNIVAGPSGVGFLRIISTRYASSSIETDHVCQRARKRSICVSGANVNLEVQRKKIIF